MTDDNYDIMTNDITMISWSDTMKSYANDIYAIMISFMIS